MREAAAYHWRYDELIRLVEKACRSLPSTTFCNPELAKSLCVRFESAFLSDRNYRLVPWESISNSQIIRSVPHRPGANQIHEAIQSWDDPCILMLNELTDPPWLTVLGSKIDLLELQRSMPAEEAYLVDWGFARTAIETHHEELLIISARSQA